MRITGIKITQTKEHNSHEMQSRRKCPEGSGRDIKGRKLEPILEMDDLQQNW